MIGMRWLQDRPRLLELAYALVERVIWIAAPLLRLFGDDRMEPIFESGERVTKGALFDCRMCGMCALHSTGMTCPMTCPKQLRNGPCGGVRPDGKCEVFPDRECVWVLAWERSVRMPRYGEEILQIQPPVDNELSGTSAWLNMVSGRDQADPVGWSRGPLDQVGSGNQS